MTGSYNNTVKIFDRYNPIEGSYKLILQDEDTNAFHDPFRATDCASSVFISSISSSSSSDSTELPWPRRLHDELIDTSDGFTNRSSFPINNNNNNVNSNESIFTVDVGRKWLQACWKPESTVAAISHSDGIHLIEAIS
ncbi:Serine/threonine-protein phosphatase 2A 55 kDa regulatory subunit B [Schistosoma japonicum]|nr:Serine/threonine-protein phosphatase 2A 55 kDa regulatory subunit B [Schistosoma japonicum]